jgi:tRNA(Ile)-lysidine synthase
MSITTLVEHSIRDDGPLAPGMKVLALLSGGADSVCLVYALRELLGPGAVRALHVNHGLRPEAGQDERFCTELCEKLGVALDLERVEIPAEGNLEAAAREARYGAAERVRERRSLDRIATGHTASDQVETVLYRLVSSPGRRALLGMKPSSGRVVRPLLRVTRAQTREYCRAVGLAWREDETNLDRRFARNRLRLDVLPLLREIHPAADDNVLSTADTLSEEAEVLETLVEEASERVAAPGAAPALDAAQLRELPPALRRLVLRRLAEETAGEPLGLRTSQLRAIEELGTRPGSASLDIGGGVRAVSEYGVLRFQREPEGKDTAKAERPSAGR